MFIKFLKKTLWKILKVNPRAYKLKSITGYKRKNNENLTIMEIGSWKGNFSENLLKIFPQSELILVDPWKVSTINKDSWYGENKQNQESMEGIYKDVVKKFKSKKNVLIHRGTVKSFYESNLNKRIDIIYVDGDHSYEGVLNDLFYADKLTVKDSIIAMDDYELEGWWKDGVVKALNEFLGKNSSKYQILGKSGSQLYIKKLNNENLTN